ncbi:hypothetical protein FI667_g3121, partial [Globisporangium splendens]
MRPLAPSRSVFAVLLSCLWENLENALLRASQSHFLAASNRHAAARGREEEDRLCEAVVGSGRSIVPQSEFQRRFVLSIKISEPSSVLLSTEIRVFIVQARELQDTPVGYEKSQTTGWALFRLVPPSHGILPNS